MMDFANVRWVPQEDSNGCVIACLAMLTDKSYAEVKRGFADRDWGFTGTSALFDGFAYLAEHGYAVAPKYVHYHPLGKDRDPWPVAPFADVHLCEVLTNQTHAVVLLRDGTVLDPLTPEPKRLTDYSKVNFITGVVAITTAGTQEWQRQTRQPATPSFTEQARELILKVLEWDYLPDSYQPLAAAIASFASEAATAALEQAAETVCEFCAQGNVPIFANEAFRHYLKGETPWTVCYANKIRLLIAAIGDDKEE